MTLGVIARADGVTQRGSRPFTPGGEDMLSRDLDGSSFIDPMEKYDSLTYILIYGMR